MFSFFTYQIHVNNNLLPNINQIITKYAKLATGNQGDWRLKICVINKPKFRVVNLKMTDKMVVLASEGVWKIFSFDDVLFLLNKFLRDASCKRQYSEESLLKAKTPEGLGFLGIPSVHLDSEYRAYLKK